MHYRLKPCFLYVIAVVWLDVMKLKRVAWPFKRLPNWNHLV